MLACVFVYLFVYDFVHSVLFISQTRFIHLFVKSLTIYSWSSLSLSLYFLFLWIACHLFANYATKICIVLFSQRLLHCFKLVVTPHIFHLNTKHTYTLFFLLPPDISRFYRYYCFQAHFTGLALEKSDGIRFLNYIYIRFRSINARSWY